jgi:hypothetical protein
MMMCSNNILQNLSLDCEKSIANVVCGKYFDEMSSLTFISLNGLFFKIFFSQKMLFNGEENKCVFCQN